MLVLGRRDGESILIGDNIRVMVMCNRRNGRVRLGVEAPPGVPVVRQELLAKADPSADDREDR